MASSKDTFLDHTYICLLAGGTGTRLWPSSRQKTPKQFAKLFTRHTLFQQTIKRVENLVPLKRVFVITNRDHSRLIHHQEPLIPDQNIIGEPQKKNTALAMGVASAFIHKIDPQAVVINLATDHLINKLDVYLNTLLAAAKFTYQKQALATIGIVPTSPHTGFEYIKLGEQVDKQKGQPVYKIDKFVKRPQKSHPQNPLPQAEKYLSSRQYLWNANNFVWSTQAILDEFKQHAPDLYQNINKIYQAIGTSKQEQVLTREYAKAKSEQIDFAIAEKSDDLYVLKGQFDWSDIGSWQVVHKLSPKDKNQNVHITNDNKQSKHLSIDSKNNLIQSEGRLIATIGVNNLVVIDTQDALLVCSLDQTQKVRDLVKQLKKSDLERYT